MLERGLCLWLLLDMLVVRVFLFFCTEEHPIMCSPTCWAERPRHMFATSGRTRPRSFMVFNLQSQEQSAIDLAFLLELSLIQCMLTNSSLICSLTLMFTLVFSLVYLESCYMGIYIYIVLMLASFNNGLRSLLHFAWGQGQPCYLAVSQAWCAMLVRAASQFHPLLKQC